MIGNIITIDWFGHSLHCSDILVGICGVDEGPHLYSPVLFRVHAGKALLTNHATHTCTVHTHTHTLHTSHIHAHSHAHITHTHHTHTLHTSHIHAHSHAHITHTHHTHTYSHLMFTCAAHTKHSVRVVATRPACVPTC